MTRIMLFWRRVPWRHVARKLLGQPAVQPDKPCEMQCKVVIDGQCILSLDVKPGEFWFDYVPPSRRSG